MIEALRFPIKLNNRVVWLTVDTDTYRWLKAWFVGTPMSCKEEQGND